MSETETALKVLDMMRRFYDNNFVDPMRFDEDVRVEMGYEAGVHYDGELHGSGADHAGFLYELLEVAGMKVP